MRYHYIDDDDAAGALDALPQDIAWLAIDTEFERQRTYYAELCLVQLSAGDTPVLLDPQATNLAGCLGNIFTRCGCGLIAHAFRQDLEVLAGYGCALTLPLYDTQIAAALLGLHEQIGYADLVREITGTTLDKSQTRTDWRRRPLSTAQLDYAADDVRYLHALRERLDEQLEVLGRRAWLNEECAALMRESCETEPTDAWQRIKGIGNLDGDSFARAVDLAAWRERRARERDLPRSWVLKDRDLLTLAERAPRDVAALRELLPEQGGLVRRQGDQLLQCLAAADPASAPPRPRAPDGDERQLARELAAAVRAIADELGIAAAVLLPRRDIDRLARGEVVARVREGWRADVLAPVVARTMA